MKKKLFALLITAIFSILLTGCGGSDPATEQAQAPAGTPTPAATSSTSTTGSTPVNNTPSSSTTDAKSQLPRVLEYAKSTLPEAFEEAVDNGYVVVVLFMNPEDLTSNKVEDIVTDVVAQPAYSKKVKYFSYDMSITPSPSVAKLSSALNAINVPSISIVDMDKNITFEDSGFTERDYIEHALYNAVYSDKGNGSSTSQVNQ